MRVSKVTLRNFLGLEEFNLDVEGPITVIEGKNGQGKSSILKGLQAFIGGGSLATLRNLNTPEGEQAEGVLVLDGEDGQVIIERTENSAKVRKQVGDSAAFEDVPAPQRFLDRLFDAPAANPVKILTASPKERVDLMLSSIPFDYDADALWERMGLDRQNFRYPLQPKNPIAEVAEIRKAVFTERTGVNRDAKGYSETCDKLRRQIPAQMPTVEDTAYLEKEIAGLNWDYGRGVEKAKADAKARSAKAVDAINALEREHEAALVKYEAVLRADLNAKVDERRKQLRAALHTQRVKSQEECEAAEDEKQERLAEAEKLREAAAQKTAELAALKEQQKSAVRIKTLAEEANRNESEARTLNAMSTRLTSALDTLDSYKAELCSGIPIDGLEIDGDGIRVDGVPWEMVNTSRQIRIAVEIACLRFRDKPLKPVFIDNGEALDSESRRQLIDALEAAGAQAFIARVSDRDLVAGAVK